MPTVHFGVRDGLPADIAERIRDLCVELEIPGEFPPEVLDEAAGLTSPQGHVDLTEVPFVTIDPASSMDLDQAVHIENAGDGYLVRYAIADVGAWVRPGGPIAQETHRRGLTYYLPDTRRPLHPTTLSESAASLLADGEARPAMVWQLRLDRLGELVDIGLVRASVRSRAKLSYEQVQQDLDEGKADSVLQLLAEVGRLRQQREQERGGVSLNLPQQEIERTDEGWRLIYRSPLPIEEWNAQISLLTGHAAARLMINAGIGILRTLPEATNRDLKRLRRIAASLRVAWDESWDYPHFIRSLDIAQPSHLAMMTACTSLFRGATYTLITANQEEAELLHGALAMPYAHTTAPLRRLVDRYVLEICHSIANGLDVPSWVDSGLSALPELMAQADQRAKKLDRALIDLTEIWLLRAQVGHEFEATVTQVDSERGAAEVYLAEPAVAAWVNRIPAAALGTVVRVRLDKAELAGRRVQFGYVGPVKE